MIVVGKGGIPSLQSEDFAPLFRLEGGRVGLLTIEGWVSEKSVVSKSIVALSVVPVEWMGLRCVKCLVACW